MATELSLSDQAHTHFAQGLALDDDKQLVAALASYERALAIDPLHAGANLNAALLLEALGRLDEAASRFMDTERLQPGYVDGLNRAGDIFRAVLGKHPEALACYERSLALSPNQPSVRLSSADCLLVMGRLAEGWAALALRATHGGPFMGWFNFPQPLWGGESLIGKRILLWCEQGFGDTFQFCRYAPALRARGAEVYLLAPPELQRILTTSLSPRGVKLVLGSAQAQPFDYHAPLMSLPQMLGINSIEAIDASTSYLFASPSATREWQERLAAPLSKAPLRIGLLWASSHRPEWPAERDLRALHLSQFKPLTAIVQAAGLQMHSLQLDKPLSQLAELVEANWGGPGIIDHSKHLHDWEDTAGLIANLDLVISCDTGVAHLAAAMGKRTWILLHHNPCWRWLQNRDDSPWYPEVKLFRQNEAGNWSDVVERLNVDLMHWASVELAKRGDLDKSLASFDLLVEAQPHSFQAWGNRANVLDDLGRTDEALASFDRALQIHPQYEAALTNRKIVLKKQADKLFNKGVLLDNAGQRDEALVCYEQACAIDHEHNSANLNAALLLEEMNRMDEAIARFIDSARIDPTYVDGLNRAGDILSSGLGRHQEALACYDRSLAINSDQRGTRWNRSHSLLALGRYAEGWPDYDAKRTMSHGDGTGWIAFPQPQWRGEPIAGKRVLLWCEQGFGDVFQFCRYVPLVQDLGATVFFMVHKTVERFFMQVFEGTGITVILGSAQASPYDYQCPLLALPAACKTDSVESIPSAKPYLRASNEDTLRWRDRLSRDFRAGKRRIGLVWASGYRPADANWQMMDLRSLHLRDFAPLADINNAAQTHIFSLQLQEPAEQLRELQSQGWLGPAVIDLGKDIDDWADTAGLVANLDLVITTDTALAHLAAAMGKPTWILLHHSHCWRWLQGRNDSPWYANVRLFKQTKAGDWTDVVSQVVLALNETND